MSDFTSKLTQVTNDNLEEDLMPVDLPPHLMNSNDVSQQDQQLSYDDDSMQQDQEEEEEEQKLRGDALFLKGVDNLSTRDIKLYLDSFLRPNLSLEDLDKNKFKFRLEWINDSSINIVFEYLDKDGNNTGDDILIDTSNLLNEALRLISLNPEDCDNLSNEELRSAHPYNKKALTTSLIQPSDQQQQQGDELDEAISLEIRQSFNTDRKVREAGKYSRYYLIHGEPTRFDRTHSKRDRYRQRDGSDRLKSKSKSYYEEYLNHKNENKDDSDLLESKDNNLEDEGLLSYETNNVDKDSRYRELASRDYRNEEYDEGRWSNDRFESQDLRSRIGVNNNYRGRYKNNRYDSRDSRDSRGGRRYPPGPIAHFRRDTNDYRRNPRFQGPPRERRGGRERRYDDDEEDLLPNFKSKNNNNNQQDIDMDYERERQRDRSPDRM